MSYAGSDVAGYSAKSTQKDYLFKVRFLEEMTLELRWGFVCVYVCVCACVYVCMCVYVCVCVCIKYIDVYIHLLLYAP